MVIAGVLTLLCLGGVGVGINLYDEATAIDRENPDVAVSNYLRAYLVDRDDEKTELFTCAADQGLEPMRAFRQDIEMRERSFDITIAVVWGPMAITELGADREVTTEITRSIAGAERSVQTWRFNLVDESGGWRVCGAQRDS